MSIILIQNSIKTTYLFRRELILKYLESGHQVIVIAINDSQEYAQLMLELGVELILISNNQTKVLQALNFNFSLFKTIQINKVKAIQCHFISTIIMCYPMLLLQSKLTTLFIEGLGSIFFKYQFLCRILKVAFSFKFRRIFMNDFEKKMLGRNSDLVLKGIGINLDLYKPKYTRSKGSFKLVYAGRLINDKGVADSFEILRLCLKSKLDVELSLYGDIYPTNPSSLSKKDITLLEVEFGSRINFLGHSNKLTEELGKYDLLLLPSKLEGFPVVVMEASALGLPSLCYKVPGCLDSIEEGVNGYLVDYRDYNAATDFINRLLCDARPSKLRRSCREYAVKNFDEKEKSAQIILQVIGS